MRRLILLTGALAVMCVATSHGVTIVIDHGADFAGGAAGNQATIDFYTNNFPDVTVIVGNYDNTADAAVQATIEAADVLVLCRSTYSGGYDAADGTYYSGLTIPVIFHTSYVTRSSRIAFEGGGEAAASTNGSETTVTAEGALVFGAVGIAAGSYDWYTDGLDFDRLGSGSVGTGDILATIGGNNLAVGWNAGDTDGSGRTQSGNRLLFNLHGNGNTLPDAAAGRQALLAAVKAYAALDVSPFAPVSPNPAKGEAVDLTALTELSWQDYSDPNITALEYEVVFGTEPNMLLNPTYTGVSNPLNLASENIFLDYDTEYYWRVDTVITWDSNDITGNLQDVAVGAPWFFTVLPQDKAPDVTADASDMDILTSLEFMPAGLTGTVNDFGEGDIQSVTWEVVGTNAPATAMQMITRGSAAALDNLAQLGIADPNLLMDWIGTDTRDDQPNKPLGDPMVLTLKGLPADTYTWKSYHHDPDVTFTGMFDAAVMDASGKAVTADIQISDSNELPVTAFETTITANGTDDVVLVFDLHPYAGLGFNDAWFVMNGFELTSTNGSLYIDFGNTNVAMPGYQAYVAQHEVLSSFTEQSYSAFGTSVSILPTWGGIATVTDTTVDLLSPTAALTTDWPASYIVRLSATDHPGGHTGSDTMTVRVAADACAAAQLDPAWTGFNSYDVDEDCDVDLSDFAALAEQWLDDRNAAGQIQL